MIYTQDNIKKIIKNMKNELKKTIFIIVLNDENEMIRDGRFISVNNKYLKIKNKKHGIHKILITDINNISTLII